MVSFSYVFFLLSAFFSSIAFSMQSSAVQERGVPESLFVWLKQREIQNGADPTILTKESGGLVSSALPNRKRFFKNHTVVLKKFFQEAVTQYTHPGFFSGFDQKWECFQTDVLASGLLTEKSLDFFFSLMILLPYHPIFEPSSSSPLLQDVAVRLVSKKKDFLEKFLTLSAFIFEQLSPAEKVFLSPFQKDFYIPCEKGQSRLYFYQNRSGQPIPFILNHQKAFARKLTPLLGEAAALLQGSDSLMSERVYFISDQGEISVESGLIFFVFPFKQEIGFNLYAGADSPKPFFLNPIGSLLLFPSLEEMCDFLNLFHFRFPSSPRETHAFFLEMPPQFDSLEGKVVILEALVALLRQEKSESSLKPEDGPPVPVSLEETSSFVEKKKGLDGVEDSLSQAVLLNEQLKQEGSSLEQTVMDLEQELLDQHFIPLAQHALERAVSSPEPLEKAIQKQKKIKPKQKKHLQKKRPPSASQEIQKRECQEEEESKDLPPHAEDPQKKLLHEKALQLLKEYRTEVGMKYRKVLQNLYAIERALRQVSGESKQHGQRQKGSHLTWELKDSGGMTLVSNHGRDQKESMIPPWRVNRWVTRLIDSYLQGNEGISK